MHPYGWFNCVTTVRLYNFVAIAIAYNLGLEQLKPEAPAREYERKYGSQSVAHLLVVKCDSSSMV